VTTTAGNELTRAFERARAVADAVLYEGYLLYPYRQSSPKNQIRWQFGVLFPRGWVEPRGPVTDGVAGSTEWWWQQTDCLLETPDTATIRLRVRYLRVQPGRSGFDEGVAEEREADLTVRDLLAHEAEIAIGDQNLPGRAIVSLKEEPAPFPLRRLRVRVENASDSPDPDQPRTQALRHAQVATHCLLGVDEGWFLSLIDPPAWASSAARECRNVRTFPVLAADEGGPSNVMLSSPIILFDHPQIAPESPGDLHDAAEIDEILSLRTLTLTDAEKLEARQTDQRAAEIVDRVDSMPPEVMAKLHGAIRSLRPVAGGPPTPDPATPDPATPDPAAGEPGEAPPAPWWDPGADESVSPETDSVVVDGVPVSKGSRVRLRPRRRGTDAHDMFLAGRTALVEAVFVDVDGSRHVAVTIEDDPSAELHQWYGRYHYYRPEELQVER
jgi:hypothetical protein